MIVMQQNLSNDTILNKITYLVGNATTISEMSTLAFLKPFDEKVMDYLNDVSKIIMRDPEAKAYPDVITFAFKMRKSSVERIRERFYKKDNDIYLGRGIAFHIAPSNVPVNYAYSLITGLLTGNANVIRIPSKDFPQVTIINRAMKKGLSDHQEVKPYICLLRYGRVQEINDYLSGIADTRIIWGGDATIAEIRKSSLPPRSSEITFADRFSMAVIDSDYYLSIENKGKVAEDFYNDTYLTDQNACTSPRIVIWTGSKKDEAKGVFWDMLHQLVNTKYTFQSIQGINKLTSSYLYAAAQSGAKIEPHVDNLIIRVNVPVVKDGLMDYKDNSGFFFEYDCGNLLEIRDLCDNKRCQTVAYIGKSEMLLPLLQSGVKGIDRVVPVGKTMDFEFLWDGYNLYERLTRVIKLN